jgi:steroid delta-isomerase-like uncharacterized protein
MSPEENIAIVQRWWEAVWNHGNIELIDDIYDVGFVLHTEWQEPQHPEAVESIGRDASKERIRSWRQAFPDLHISIDDIFAEGPFVACRYTATGTNRGELMGRPPTNRRTFMTGMTFLRVAGGKITEAWINWDTIGLMQDIGILPSPEQLRDRDRQAAQERSNA